MVQHFAHSILKRRADGTEVLSSYLDDGETLVGAKEAPTAEPGPESTLTVTEDKVNTVAADAPEPDSEAGKIDDSEPGPESTLTTVDNVNAVGADALQGDGEQGDDDGEQGESSPAQDEAQNQSEQVSEKTETVERPKDTDNKQAWFDYAKTQGFDGEYDEVTKNALIERYGK